MSTTVQGGVIIQHHRNENMAKGLQKRSSSMRNNGNSTLCSSRSCSFRLPRRKELYPLKYFKFLGGKMVEAIQAVSGKQSSPRVIKHGVPPVDSHRAEAIDDCIEFINSSSSFPRSKSASR